MENFPGNEEDKIERQRLELDLNGPEGNVFMVMGKARELLEDDQLAAYNKEIREAITPGSGKKYPDILSIVNSYVDLIDRSDVPQYPQYAPKPEVEE